jgi:hypothetical protein
MGVGVAGASAAVVGAGVAVGRTEVGVAGTSVIIVRAGVLAGVQRIVARAKYSTKQSIMGTMPGVFFILLLSANKQSLQFPYGRHLDCFRQVARSS